MTYYVLHWLVIVCASIVVKRIWPEASSELKVALYTIACVITLPLASLIYKRASKRFHKE